MLFIVAIECKTEQQQQQSIEKKTSTYDLVAVITF